MHRLSFAGVVTVGVSMASAGAEPPSVDRFDLPNGVRVVAIQIQGAARQTTFTFLPLSLATDRAGEAQWSHLIEHMLLRSTDPFTLSPPGMLINGETTADSVRLETIAEPDAWRESIDRHAAWLAARDFDEETLEREKLAIAGEESGTVMSRATHKWAIAAWNQAVRHGAKHVELHGDVAEARLDVVEHATVALLPRDSSVLVVSLGPTPITDVRERITQSIGALTTVSADTVGAAIDAAAFTGSHVATWDLPTRHVMLWWRLPADTLSVRAIAHAIAPAIAMQLSRTPREWEGRGGAIAVPIVSGPDGSILLLASVLAPDGIASDEVVRFATDRVRGLLEAPNRVSTIAKATSRTFGEWPDFDRLRQGATPDLAAILEVNALLHFINAEFSIGATRDDIRSVLAEPDERVCREITAALSMDPMGALDLHPLDASGR